MQQPEVSASTTLILPRLGSSLSFLAAPTLSWCLSTRLSRATSNPRKSQTGPWQRLFWLINDALRANEGIVPSLLELRTADAGSSSTGLCFGLGFLAESVTKLQVVIKDLKIAVSG